MGYQIQKENRIAPASAQLGFTRRQAAAMLAVSVESLDRLVARGLIKPSRALRKPLFTREELQRFLGETQA
jgi:hypothetical protein